MWGKKYYEWKMEDLLKEFLIEFELKEEYCIVIRNFYLCDKDKGWIGGGLNFVSVLLVKMNDFCVYCKGGYVY